MKLTDKQEKFCRVLVSGTSQADAYRAAYNAEKMKPETVQRKACELMKDGKVSARVYQLRDELAERSGWTREDSVRELRVALADGGAVRVAALKELNSMHGYNAPQKHEHKGDMTITAIVRTIVDPA